MALIITQGVEYQQLLDDLRALIRHEMAQTVPAAPIGGAPAAEELLTVQGAAALLNVCVATVHEWKRRGLLAYTKLGGRAYLKRADVLAAGTAQQRTHKPSRPKHKPAGRH
jgi:excisionase family DNA binding protein